jgi:D-glycero-alpha-D-manno-heptose-7-phosphate kinase
VADAGGWTDTWFAGHGAVCHVAVRPGAAVRVVAHPGSGHVALNVQSYGDAYEFHVAAPPGRHRLVESAIVRWLPAGCDASIDVGCQVPPGCAVGTSAAVTVATIAALLALAGRPVDPIAVAAAAHGVETVDLGLQSGVQDQLAAACGGPSLVIVDEFPHAEVHRIDTPLWDELSRRLVTVYLGTPHDSSAVHDQVIASLTPEHLEPLRRGAHAAADALGRGDLTAYAAALTACTQGQRSLHAALVSPAADEVIARGGEAGALGWKVNGAGGDGGSVTFVAGDDAAGLRRALADWDVLAVRPTHDGVVVKRT